MDSKILKLFEEYALNKPITSIPVDVFVGQPLYFELYQQIERANWLRRHFKTLTHAYGIRDRNSIDAKYQVLAKVMEADKEILKLFVELQENRWRETGLIMKSNTYM